MKISSCNSLNKKLQSQNSLSSVETLESPIQLDQKAQQKKYTQRLLQSNVLSKENLRQQIEKDSFSSKTSIRRLDSYNLSDNGNPSIISERNIAVPVKTNNYFINQQQKSSYHKKNQISAAQQEIFDDYSDEYMSQNTHSNYPSQFAIASQNQFCCIDDEFENESDSDEHNIWDNSDALAMKINVIDSDIAFNFCELYYIRSQLYQANKVNKNDVLSEVQVISKMCKKQMDLKTSSKLIDLIEKNYHLSINKNKIQVSKIKIEQAKLALPQRALKSSESQKLSQPKQFRIAKNPLYTPKHQVKSPSFPNILEQDMSSPYQGNHRLLVKSNTNLKTNSIESPQLKQKNQSNIQPLTLSTVKKVNLTLSSPLRVTSSKGFVNENFEAVNKNNIFNNLGKTMGPSKFYQCQEIMNY